MKKVRLIAIIACLIVAAAFTMMPLTVFGEITTQPQNYTYPEYSVAIYSCDCDSEDATYRWFVRYDGVIYDLEAPNIMDAPWVAFAESGFGVSPNGKEIFFDGILSGLSGATVFCAVKSGTEEVATQEAYISVCEQGLPMPPTIRVAAYDSFYTDEDVILNCVITPNEGVEYSYNWCETSNGTLPGIKAITYNDTARTDQLVLGKLPEGTYHYCCSVEAKNSKGTAISYSSIITVTVSEPPPTEVPTEAPTETPTEVPTETPAPPTEKPTDEPEKTDAPTETPDNTAPQETPDQESSTPSSADATDMPLNTEAPEKSDFEQFFEKYALVFVIAAAALLAVVVALAVALTAKKKK